MNNTGLPLSTLICFGAVMIGLTIGWIAIVLHKQNMDLAATALVQDRLVDSSTTANKGGDDVVNLGKMLKDAKADIAEAKTFKQRFFSLKALHGISFFVSWMQITGRIFASNQSGDFTCYTYPVYKPIDTAAGDFADQNLTLVPANDPDYDSLPWANGAVAWSLQIILGSLFGAAFVGAVWSYWAARKARKNEAAASSTALSPINHMPEDASDPSSHSGVEDSFDVKEGKSSKSGNIESAVSVLQIQES
jgi:hypothetical protein